MSGIILDIKLLPVTIQYHLESHRENRPCQDLTITERPGKGTWEDLYSVLRVYDGFHCEEDYIYKEQQLFTRQKLN